MYHTVPSDDEHFFRETCRIFRPTLELEGVVRVGGVHAFRKGDLRPGHLLPFPIHFNDLDKIKYMTNFQSGNIDKIREEKLTLEIYWKSTPTNLDAIFSISPGNFRRRHPLRQTRKVSPRGKLHARRPIPRHEIGIRNVCNLVKVIGTR